jgi:deazaflavin-dependent oxidoreductase (nitroreductase family)
VPLNPRVRVQPSGLAAAGAERYRRFLFWLGRRQLFNWLGPRVFAPIDTWLYPRVHGAVVSAGPPVLPLLMLTTWGRQSGRARAVPLLYLRRNDELLVVASNWGRANHPAWSSNLLANPTAVVQLGAVTYPVSAHLLTSNEKACLWPELCRFCPVWQTYADRSARDLRVFSLTAQMSLA